MQLVVVDRELGWRRRGHQRLPPRSGQIKVKPLPPARYYLNESPPCRSSGQGCNPDQVATVIPKVVTTAITKVEPGLAGLTSAATFERMH